MKIRDLTIWLVIITFVLVGCGKTDNPKKNNIVSTTVRMPVIGVASQVQDSFFVLVTMPEKYGDQNGQTNIDSSKAKVEDPNGKPAKIEDGATVTVDGEYGDNEVIAKSIIVNAVPNSQKIPLKLPDNLEVPTAGLIRNFLGNKVPADFNKGWKLENTGSMQEKQGSKVYDYKKGEWRLLLMSDPKSSDKYAITLYGPNKFIWTGTQTNEDKLKSSK